MQEGTVLCFDFGLARTGVASGNTLTRSAQPVTIIHARTNDERWKAVEALVKEWEPVLLVVGVPRHGDGTDCDLTPRCERFARRRRGRRRHPATVLRRAGRRRLRKPFMRYVIGCGRMAAVGIMILVILFILLVLFPLVGRKGRGRCVRRVCRVLMRVLGVRMTVRGAVPVAQRAECGVNGEGPGYMVCANHVSFIDIFILDAVLPCRFVAKKEIASWPVFGFIARGTGTLFIDRSRKRAVLEIADAMAGAINEGTNVLFFPEGTTGNGLELLPFHPNLFEAAVRSGAQILPVTLRYTLDGKPSGLVSYAGDVALFTVLKRILFTPGLGVEVTVLDPVSVDGKTRQALCLEASALMSGALGVSDVTAEREEARRRRLQAMSETKAEAEKTV